MQKFMLFESFDHSTSLTVDFEHHLDQKAFLFLNHLLGYNSMKFIFEKI